jgi:hypothetical protein
VAHAAAGGVDEPRARRALLPLLAAAAETGRLLLVLERGEPALVTPWYRLAAPEPHDEGALPVAGAVALNLAALPAEGEARLVESLEPAIALAIKALKQKRSFMTALSADPSGPLYRVAAGARPLVAGARGVDLVHLVGVREVARRLETDPAAAARLAGRLRAYAAVRIAEEGRGVRIRAIAAPDRDGEAAERFFRGARPEPDPEPFALPPAVGFPAAEPLFEPVTSTLTLRFPRDQAPAPESLYSALCLLARDPRVGAFRLAPWPDRSVRAGRTEL